MKKVSSREEFLKEVLNIIGETCDAVEIGVMNGKFSEMIYQILKPYNLTLIDPFKINEEKYPDGLTTAYSTDKEYKKVEKIFENEKYVFVDKRFSYDAVKDYKDGEFEFIYIDACHLYECVKKDLNDWLPKLKSGGLMCGHDYFVFNGFGVIEAVDEFCTEHNFEMIIFNSNGGDWALKQK